MFYLCNALIIFNFKVMALKNIGLFLGSFNPIHNGHLMVATDIKNKCGLDLVVFSLTPQNPLKEYENKLDIIPYSDKFAMLKKAVSNIDYFEASDIESTLPYPNYTYQTLDKFAEIYPEAQLYLIIGEDEFEILNRWKNYEYILSTYKLIVAKRNHNEEKLAIKHYSKYIKNIQFVDSLNIDISSTFIRENIRNRKNVDSYLPNDVHDYINMYSLNTRIKDETESQVIDYPKVPSLISNSRSYSNAYIYNIIKSKVLSYLKEHNIKSITIGLSGGLDSSVNAYIFSEVCKELGIELNGRFIIVDKYNHYEMYRAKSFGLLFCNTFQVDNLTDMYKLYLEAHETKSDNESDFDKKVRRGNIKARLRMIHLYDINQQKKGLVSDNDNKTERELGFWTLHGDVGDITPLASLYKTEVFSLAVYIYNEKCKTYNEKKAFEDVIKAVPTDGLGITSSDLEQIGAKSYHDVDEILFSSHLDSDLSLLKNKYGDDVVEKVMKRQYNSSYKRNHPYRIEIF